MKLISIVTPCYNEEENVREVNRQVKEVFERLPGYTFEHIFIDNASTDKTVQVLREMAAEDKKVKVIVNSRNFGHIRSPFHAFLQTKGDAATILAADLQEPPVLIYDFIKKWEAGYKIVIAIKRKSAENKLMFFLRRMYYKLVKKMADIELVQNFGGYGLYDRKVIEILREVNDPYPYFRGLICEIGFERAEIEFDLAVRKKGKTKNNIYTLFDMAMLGITSHSKVPLRLATMMGFFGATISILIAAGYFVYKLIFWDSFTVGIAPLVIGLFFFGAVQLFFIGILGEYIGAIFTHVQKRMLVVEKERINF